MSFIVIGIKYEVVDFLSERKQADEWQYDSNYQSKEELIVVDIFHHIKIEGKHSGNECSGIVKTFYSEEDPAN